MKTILILSDSYDGYGAEYMLVWLGNSLCKSGYRVTFCSIFDKRRKDTLDSSSNYYSMYFPYRLYNMNYFLNGVKYLRNLCKGKKYDYVITFHTNPYLMALLTRPFCGFKILHSERDNPYARNTFFSKLKSWLYRYADIVVFQTLGAQLYFDKKTQKKSVLIPNPVVVPEISWKGGINKTLVNVGRFDLVFKRQDLLLDAFADIALDFPEYKLVFYGDGKDRKKIEEHAMAIGLINRVHFLGKVSKLSELLVEDSIFVMTSDSEGMPNALMEAMALGMPVISTDCEPGGAAALIDNGINGLLIKRSSIEELSFALRNIINNTELQCKLGCEARKKMRLFAPELILNKWIDLLNK